MMEKQLTTHQVAADTQHDALSGRSRTTAVNLGCSMLKCPSASSKGILGVACSDKALSSGCLCTLPALRALPKVLMHKLFTTQLILQAAQHTMQPPQKKHNCLS